MANLKDREVDGPASTGPTSTVLPLTLADLRDSDYNPRTISLEAAQGLAVSLTEFGDLSGITWNRVSGCLIAGHQRLAELRREYGEAMTVTPIEWDEAAKEGTAWLVLPDSRRFRIRVVEWEATRERAANLAANNAALAGRFTTDVDALLDELTAQAPDLVDTLLLDKIRPEVEGDVIGEVEAEDAEAKAAIGTDRGGPEAMALQPYEHYDYLVVLAKRVPDWEWLVDFVELERVNASPIAGKRKIGLGRGIAADRFIQLVEAYGLRQYAKGVADGKETAHGAAA